MMRCTSSFLCCLFIHVINFFLLIGPLYVCVSLLQQLDILVVWYSSINITLCLLLNSFNNALTGVASIPFHVTANLAPPNAMTVFGSGAILFIISFIAFCFFCFNQNLLLHSC